MILMYKNSNNFELYSRETLKKINVHKNSRGSTDQSRMLSVYRYIHMMTSSLYILKASYEEELIAEEIKILTISIFL